MKRVSASCAWAAIGMVVVSLTCHAQQPAAQNASPAASPDRHADIEQFNQRLAAIPPVTTRDGSYRIGQGDLLDITVLEAPDLNRSVRVSADGAVTLPPLEAVNVAGKTPREVETAIAGLLRQSIMKDPHVSVFVKEMESHTVSVTGAVKKPGVFPIRGPKPLLEMISMAEGLAEDAGDSVVVMRGSEGAPPSPAAEAPFGQPEPASPGGAQPDSRAATVALKSLFNSTDSRFNVLVYPGDTVKVNRAGIIYVLGDVKKPGGFVLQNNENISILQALAMAEGTTPTASKGKTRIIRTDVSSGQRSEIAVNLDDVMKGKISDPYLQPKDIVFVPRSGGKSAFFRSAEAIVSSVPGALIYGAF